MTTPAQNESLAEGVRARLEAELLDGTLRPGQVLDERSLAERFGVSRTPVREAVQSLAFIGLLRIVPRVGVVVPTLTIKELLSLLEMLAELEGACAKFAARRMTAGERADLRVSFEECQRVAEIGDLAAYDAANKTFHELIGIGARNEWAANQIRTLRSRCAAYQRARFELPGRLKRSLSEHRAVLASIERGDEDAVRASMTEHIGVGGRDFAEIVSGLQPYLLGERA